MKIQCSCGTKYDFAVTPEMAQSPIKFVCQNCGADSSDFVNELIRQQFAPITPTPPPAPVTAPAPIALKISPKTEADPAPEKPAVESKFCSRHRQEKVTERCVICEKPICPQCIDVFGNTCSPACKAVASSQGIAVRAQLRSKTTHEEQLWEKTGWLFGAAGIGIMVFLAVWTWYAWYASIAHPIFTAHFDVRAYSGKAILVDPKQLVLLHGGTLAHYQLGKSKPLWSLELVPYQLIKVIKDTIARQPTDAGPRLSGEEMEKAVRNSLSQSLSLHVLDHNIWVASPGKLTHYDWDSGNVIKEIPLPGYVEQITENQGKLRLLAHADNDNEQLTLVNLATAEVQTEEFHDTGASTVPALIAQNNQPGGGLPFSPNQTGDGALDPQKFAQQAQNLTTPARIALPALLGNALHQQQLQAALAEDDPERKLHVPARASAQKASTKPQFNLVVGNYDCVQFASKVLEEKFFSHDAMKAPYPKKIADGDLSTGNENAAINETLNDMQRANGGNLVTEDVSRYQVTLRATDATTPNEWTGEIVGQPWVYPLKSVNVITGGKQVVVLDKSNQKLWEAKLANTISTAKSLENLLIGHESPYGAGPCVEHDDELFVADQVVLTAFDLTSGDVRWRLPSVGVVGLFFDDQGNVYVNTTTGSPDDVKYSKQINLNHSAQAVLVKIEAKTGKVLWNAQPGGFVTYVKDKNIYTLQSNDPNPFDEDSNDDSLAALQKPAYLHLARVRASDGHVIWEYQQDRAPVDVQFRDNTIEFVFKRDVQVLKYLTF